jgi:hypothetical protein
MTSLDGVWTALILWLFAAAYGLLALAFCIIGLRTGRDKLWGHRMIFGLGLAAALWVGSFQLRHLPASALRALDEASPVWILPVFLLGLWACFRVGRRHAPAKREH